MHIARPYAVLLAAIVCVASASAPAQTLTEFPIPTGVASDMTKGPDGNLWFTEPHASLIGRITPNGTITEFPVPTDNSLPNSIALGSDSNL